MRVGKKKLVSGICTFVLAVQLSGCAIIPEAIEYRNLYTNYKMSDTIFLDITKKAKYRNVYVDVRNTSQFQEVDVQSLKKEIADRIASKGYKLLDIPEGADYIVQVNVLYFDYYRKTGARDGALTGGIAGGAGGFLAGGRDVEALILAALGAGVGYVGGALIGSAIKVETFAGVVDVQIMERAENPVVGRLITDAKQGAVTTLRTEQEVQSNYQIYRTKLAVTATQTNLNRQLAAQEITKKLAEQISGIF